MKMKNFSLLLLSLTLLFISACSQNIQQMQYVVRWPETYCNKDTTKVVCNQIPLKFTLVGFWGTDSNAQILKNCKDTGEQDWNKVFDTTMVNKLNPFWPSLTKQDPKDMWKEAWKTYGTCTIQRFKGPTQYFNGAARVAGEIKDLLQDHLIKSDGIVPCDSAVYKNVEILNSFKQVSKNKEVSFTCTNINNTHAYLNQVTFCLTNDAKHFTNCPTSVISRRCSVENIIVPRPSPPARASSLQTLQRTAEKLRPNSIWESLRQLI
ncbi:ribonuclease S-4-like [Lycium barbarum]|uniref:ribonuclease S-4-like n=1 Tax=Lycium barbarum TaxID=112863 RepID=UPI00293E5E6C|nr:ribonuclease S-4-like [Lycium barbarum]